MILRAELANPVAPQMVDAAIDAWQEQEQEQEQVQEQEQEQVQEARLRRRCREIGLASEGLRGVVFRPRL